MSVCSSRTGCWETISGPLWHIHNGVLFYVGLKVLPPFIAWSPVYGGEVESDGFIRGYGDRLLSAATDEPMRFHPTTDFDTDFRMKSEVVPMSPGHWRPTP